MSPASILEFTAEAVAVARTVRRAAAVDGREVCSVTLVAPDVGSVDQLRRAVSDALQTELGHSPAVLIEVRGESVRVVAIQFVPRA